MNKLSALTIALLVVATPAISAPDEAVVREMLRKSSGLSKEEIRANYNACDSGITLSMKICASYRWVKQDVRLNQIYKQSLDKARESGYEKSLVQAQRAWLAYRDAACAYEGEMGAGGGTAEGLYILSCKEDLTKERADRLEAALH